LKKYPDIAAGKLHFPGRFCGFGIAPVGSAGLLKAPAESCGESTRKGFRYYQDKYY
jgi:hypothetical protein